ncbi:hypothetical protein L1F30_01995 [Simiduia sp. 21SJ11W-1]|uniref:hypothetical protein n=1 Tax=Simiduia sp. 21SJ11W-1 TaxID=2909669 RepID=UPI00209EA178|nr:hypothetical protein [Simiduia sp. 21SJ11W-1]UTA48327.1 hypothetical protein L1F30_01995 [Simiduia sp. 21SJ11W-1]
MKIPTEEDKLLAKKANELAKKISAGDKDAKVQLVNIIQTNWYVAKLVARLRKKASRLNMKCPKYKKRSKVRLQGSVMHGLAGHTSSKNWKKTK